MTSKGSPPAIQQREPKINREAAALVREESRGGDLAHSYCTDKTRFTMLGISDHARSTPPNAGDIARRVASLEQRLKRIGKREPVAEQDSLGEAVAAALSGIAERFRGSASSIGDGTTNLSNEAVKLGNDAWRRVAKEVEHRPLVTLAVAVGVGILVGLASHRRAE
jgi:ElaB/YqjD/DUF883 family membrane-anchored ribosome-binding protein